MRFILIMVASGVAMLSPVLAEATQPIAYSHKLHISKGLACLDCHSGADMQASATIPSVRKCMLCHTNIAKDKPEIQKLAAYSRQGHEVPWVRVYEFEPSALVKFKHAPHVNHTIACATCHGDMTQATTAQKLVTHTLVTQTLGSCISCHRQNHASDDCSTCHY